jgi:hypothetical protein
MNNIDQCARKLFKIEFHLCERGIKKPQFHPVSMQLLIICKLYSMDTYVLQMHFNLYLNIKI